MTLNVKCSVSMHLFISSSVQSVFVSFCSTSWSDFAIVFLSCFMTHTPRDRKYALNFFWHVIVANLKSSSVHSANSSRKESHKSLSSSSSHFIIFAFINWSAGTKAEAIIDLRDALTAKQYCKGSSACRGRLRNKRIWWFLNSKVVCGVFGLNSRIGLDGKMSRAAGQRGMTDNGEISGLSKSRSRFAQMLRSSRRSAILGPATSKKHWLGLQGSELNWLVSR
jgi:hypothetical protein